MRKIPAYIKVLILITVYSIMVTIAFAADLTHKPPIPEPEIIIEYVDRIIEIEVDKSFKVELLDDFVDDNLFTYSVDDLQLLMDECTNNQAYAHNIAQAARELGWPEDSDAIQCAKTVWENNQKAFEVYYKRYKEIEAARWEEKRKEFPAATEVWLYMKALGWNDYVCAGIMGNLMAETGGQTLNLNPNLYYKNSYYGICQWNDAYKEIWDANLETQCHFLRDTIEYEINTYGYKYKTGFKYTDFLNMSNSKECALAFAESYERCNPKYFAIRLMCAEKAYDYFVNN